ncbi:hypothetical protein ABK040_008159 [Willaertia magna]
MTERYNNVIFITEDNCKGPCVNGIITEALSTCTSNIPLVLWDSKHVENWMKHLNSNIKIFSEVVIQISRLSPLFYFHCITGLDLVELTWEDVFEIINTDLSTIEEDETISKEDKEIIVETLNYVNNSVNNSIENLKLLAKTIHGCIINMKENVKLERV